MTRKKYRAATIKLIIGCVLLGASWWYLGQHPAEKSSLLSGVEVLKHRAHIRITGIQGKDTNAIEQQYKIKRYMDEIRYTAQHTSGCESTELIQTIDQTIQDMDTLAPSEIYENAATYRNDIRTRENCIQNHCASSSNPE